MRTCSFAEREHDTMAFANTDSKQPKMDSAYPIEEALSIYTSFMKDAFSPFSKTVQTKATLQLIALSNVDSSTKL